MLLKFIVHVSPYSALGITESCHSALNNAYHLAMVGACLGHIGTHAGGQKRERSTYSSAAPALPRDAGSEGGCREADNVLHAWPIF